MAAKLQDAIAWLVTTINNDTAAAALGLNDAFMYSVPETQQPPYVVIGKQAGGHKINMCGVAYDTHYLAIKCVDHSLDGGARARNIVDRIRALIEFQTPTLASGRILSIIPNNSYEYDEQESGDNSFYHCVVSEKVILGS